MSLHDHAPFRESEAAPRHRPLALPPLRGDQPRHGELPLSAHEPPYSGGRTGGNALESVLQCRLEQIEKWGHTPEKDRERPLRGFLVDIASLAQAAREDHQFHHNDDPARIRKRLVKLGALILATLDRIDAEPGA